MLMVNESRLALNRFHDLRHSFLPIIWVDGVPIELDGAPVDRSLIVFVDQNLGCAIDIKLFWRRSSYCALYQSDYDK